MVQKKYVIIGAAAAVLVVAAVVLGTVLGIAQKNKHHADAPPSGKNISASSKAVQQLCAPTDYKETCVKALSSAGNKTDPTELIKVAFRVAVEQITGAIKKSSVIKKAEQDPLVKGALANCRELLEFSINDLKRSFDQIGEFDMSNLAVYMANLKTWLSAAITYQQTCLDGFDNTTGNTGEQMRKLLKTSGELTSNGLAIVTNMAKVLGLSDLPVSTNRRLLSEDGFPSWVSDKRRKLLEAPLKPNVVVAQDGSGKYKTVNEALKDVPESSKKDNNVTPFVIYIKEGVYKEYVNITKKMSNVVFIGDGPTKTKITGSKNFVDGVNTYKTATVSVDGQHFMAKNIGFENSAGASKHQAVALRVSSDLSVLYNVQIDGYQDTLYCHTHRQFYRDCTISGTIDFIFGDAAAVFQNCKLVVNKPDEGQNCMVTAQGRSDKRGVTGIVLQNCTIVGSPEFIELTKGGGPEVPKAFLGRPWKNFSRTVVMQSNINDIIDPEGWAPWMGTASLDTLWYAEYGNRGKGADKSKRVKWSGVQKKISSQMAESFTAGNFINADTWLPQTGVPFRSGLKFKWQLVKKASQVLYLHFALKKRAFFEEIHEKQEQVREWLQNLGIGDHTEIVQVDDEADDESIPLQNNDESTRTRDVPSSAVLPVIHPVLGRQHSVLDRAKVAMQGYLNNFLSNLDIVNYREVWAVLKPGFLALLKDPSDDDLLDIVVFDVLPPSDGNRGDRVLLAKEVKERNPLRHSFREFIRCCGNRSIQLRTKSNAKVKDWVSSINDAVLQPPEGWCHPHRYGSFAPPRGLTEDGSQAQWFVDGRAAFEAIALAIEEAKSEIFICGWWLCPELYLRRPFDACASSRLDALLEAKAKQGVQIYILMYKEVAIALKINSVYSKRKLLGIHENVRVLRYPDHFSSGVYLWSHHEKIVIVDYRICFIGGLDLCFGRYDSFEHRVGDYPSSEWPGKDYYNPRESEPNSWEDAMKDELDRQKYPRMPWHDVHCAVWGPPCRDVARHFVQRWNYAKRNKAPNEATIPLLMPQYHMVIPRYMGGSRDVDIPSEVRNNHKGMTREDSFSSRSSNQDVPLLMPREVDDPETSDEDLKSNASDRIHNIRVHSNKRSRSPFSFRKPKIEPLISDMQMRGFVDNSDHDSPDIQRCLSSDLFMLPNNKVSGKEWREAQERGEIVSVDEAGQVGPRVSCRCQVIRSVSQWSAGTSQVEESIHNAYCSLIEKAESFIYIKNQFFISGLSGNDVIRNRVLEALYRRILRAYNDKKCFRVIIVIPLLPGFQGGVDDSGAAAVRSIMHWQYRTICRGPNSILHKLFDDLGSKTHDYISFYGLRAYGRLFNGGPLASSPVYVHSKIMIVDDCFTLIGSANINDRSLLGSRDSEIALLFEDKEFVDSCMGGKPWKAGKFASSLRLSLWSEHLGLRSGEFSKISDLVVDSTYEDTWMATAKTNTMIYEDVFFCLPNDLIHTRVALRQCMANWKEKLGHTTIDLGIAPEKLESYEDGIIKCTNPMDRLECIKGHLVSFSLDYMCKEDLRPVFNESEYYASQVFH